MGIDWASVGGYGFILDNKDDLFKIAKEQLIYPSGYDSYEHFITYTEGDLEGNITDEEIIEEICNKHDLTYVTAGDSWSGEIGWLIGVDLVILNRYTSNKYDKFIELPVDTSVYDKLRIVQDALGIVKPIKIYIGLHVY
jgi:hypothetical protein